MRWVRRLVVAAFFVAALVIGWRLAQRNAALVHVDYLAGTLDEPVWAVLLGMTVLGAGIASLVFGFHALRLALTARRYRKLARGLENEVHQLRNLPLGPPDARPGEPAPEARARSG
jgi:uncharacterized integral membrane protein